MLEDYEKYNAENSVSDDATSDNATEDAAKGNYVGFQTLEEQIHNAEDSGGEEFLGELIGKEVKAGVGLRNGLEKGLGIELGDE